MTQPGPARAPPSPGGLQAPKKNLVQQVVGSGLAHHEPSPPLCAQPLKETNATHNTLKGTHPFLQASMSAVWPQQLAESRNCLYCRVLLMTLQAWGEGPTAASTRFRAPMLPSPAAQHDLVHIKGFETCQEAGAGSQQAPHCSVLPLLLLPCKQQGCAGSDRQGTANAAASTVCGSQAVTDCCWTTHLLPGATH